MLFFFPGIFLGAFLCLIVQAFLASFAGGQGGILEDDDFGWPSEKYFRYLAGGRIRKELHGMQLFLDGELNRHESVVLEEDDVIQVHRRIEEEKVAPLFPDKA